MQKSKLITFLKTLSKEELSRFRDYMQSPFFKKSANAKALFEWIDRQDDYPFYTSSQLDSSVVGSHLFPNKKNKALRDKGLSVAASELIALLRQCLVQLEEEKDKTRTTYITLQILRNRRMEKDFWQMYKKSIINIENRPNDLKFYYDQYLFKELLYEFRPLDKHLQRKKKKLNLSIHDVVFDFEIYTILMKLQYCCFIWNNFNIIEEDRDSVFARQLIEVIHARQLDQIPLIHFYYLNLLLLIDAENENYFYQLKKLLKNNATEISKNHLKSFYIMAVNYCHRRVRKGMIDFNEELFDLYLLMLEQKLFYKGKYIGEDFVKNIVTVGLQVNQSKWVERFIESSQKEVVPLYRNSVYAFNKGLWYFHHEKYGKALPMLLQVGNIHVFYNLDCRGVLLKCYYELQETEPLFSLADAFRKFVQLQKIAPNQKKAYLNFIRQTVKLYKIKLHPNKSPDAAFRQKLQEVQPLNNQKWLLEKVEEL